MYRLGQSVTSPSLPGYTGRIAPRPPRWAHAPGVYFVAWSNGATTPMLYSDLVAA